MNPSVPCSADCNHGNFIQEAFDDVFNECCVDTLQTVTEEPIADEEEEETPPLTTFQPHLVDAVLGSAIDEIFKRDCGNSTEIATDDPGGEGGSSGCLRNDHTTQSDGAVMLPPEIMKKMPRPPTKKKLKKKKDTSHSLFVVKKVHVLQKQVKQPSKKRKIQKIDSKLLRRESPTKATQTASVDDLNVSRVGLFSDGRRVRKVLGSDRQLRTLQPSEVRNSRYHVGGVWEDIVCNKI